MGLSVEKHLELFFHPPRLSSSLSLSFFPLLLVTFFPSVFTYTCHSVGVDGYSESPGLSELVTLNTFEVLPVSKVKKKKGGGDK